MCKTLWGIIKNQNCQSVMVMTPGLLCYLIQAFFNIGSFIVAPFFWITWGMILHEIRLAEWYPENENWVCRSNCHKCLDANWSSPNVAWCLKAEERHTTFLESAKSFPLFFPFRRWFSLLWRDTIWDELTRQLSENHTQDVALGWGKTAWNDRFILRILLSLP